MNWIIFDLDGTLADCAHRVPLLPDWDAFYSACNYDRPIKPMVELYKSLVADDSYFISIWSGRRESEFDKTIDWFELHHIPLSDDIRMRPNGDHRPDTELKLEWLTGSGDTPILVFEDRSSVVKMYRDKGIQVCQVANGDF